MRNKEFIIPTVFLLLIVLSGIYIRIDGLANLGLAFDETIHLYAAKSILETGEPTLPSGYNYNRSIFFTYAVALSFKLFGVNEFTARLPSIIFGTLSIILVFFIGRRFFGSPVGLIAAFLMAFLPFEIVWSRTCRMYSMYQAFFLAGFLTFYLGLENEQRVERSARQSKNWSLYNLSVSSYWNLNLAWLFLSAILLFVAYRLQTEVVIFYGSVLAYLISMSFFDFIALGARQTFRRKYFLLFVFLSIAGVVALALPGVYSLLQTHSQFSPLWAKQIRVSPSAYRDFLLSPVFSPIMAFFVLGAIQACVRVNKAGLYTFMAATVP